MSKIEQILAERSSVKRIVALDSLRGLAACTVFLGHFVGGIYKSPLPLWLRLMPPSGAAVILFFVLSGHVLAIPVWRGKQGPYPQYLVRRFFRIYVPYAAAVCAALIGAAKLNGVQLPLSPWFYLTWHTPLTRSLIAAQFLKMSTSPAINTAFWSLRYEVEMSIIFPLICWLVLRLRAWGTLAFGCLCALGGQAIIHFNPSAGFGQETGITILWSSCFIFGALTSWKSREIGAIFARVPRAGKLLLAVLVYAAYVSRPHVIIIPAAVLIIIFAEHSRLRRWLSAPLPEYLGRISYSLYLTHGTVLFTLLILLYGKISLWLILAIYMVAALSFAHLFCIAIEEPSMRIGKRLGKPRSQPAPSLQASESQ
jgi:peptidoglycan/LPS O-acetylase OafA/YrhL